MAITVYRKRKKVDFVMYGNETPSPLEQAEYVIYNKLESEYSSKDKNIKIDFDDRYYEADEISNELRLWLKNRGYNERAINEL